MTTSIFIKNMVCDRCKVSVQHILNQLEIGYNSLELGEVNLQQPLDSHAKAVLAQALSQAGFELLEDRDTRLISQIKSAVIHLVHYHHELGDRTLSGHLTVHLNREYSTLSKLFSQVEGRTIEKYFIEQRIERAKELLVYDELNLSQIALELGYSSVAHLSAQFKKRTGMTPSHFKKLGSSARKGLDKV
ncbi:MAG: AraC family transcriptional regulator [Owenweeksia sp.]|nr:AraC family transcriptional regulator [Owenweeksia sp.]